MTNLILLIIFNCNRLFKMLHPSITSAGRVAYAAIVKEENPRSNKREAQPLILCKGLLSEISSGRIAAYGIRYGNSEDEWNSLTVMNWVTLKSLLIVLGRPASTHQTLTKLKQIKIHISGRLRGIVIVTRTPAATEKPKPRKQRKLLHHPWLPSFDTFKTTTLRRYFRQFT